MQRYICVHHIWVAKLKFSLRAIWRKAWNRLGAIGTVVNGIVEADRLQYRLRPHLVQCRNPEGLRRINVFNGIKEML